MRRLFLLFVLLATASVGFAQTNLVANPGFESWTDGKPDGWNYSSSLTPIRDTTIVKNGVNALRLEAPSTTNFSQNISITSGKVYELSFDYYVISGDGSDVRIWSGFRNSGTGSTMSAADMTTLGVFTNLRGPGGSSSTAYLPNGSTPAWQSYKTSFTAPNGYDQFTYQINLYATSKSVWDNFYFGEAASSGVSLAASSEPGFTVSGVSLLAKNIPDGTDVAVYNVVGAKVLSAKVSSGEVQLNSLQKGVYVVKSGTISQKIILQHR
ncbi:MAG: hypothetical protein BGN96_03490 [Bacteroidales bacterium 45-6]|nr:MAG: hypothetical protein BGN96_03490 [Bacteroidales bacterium 45-6]